MDHELMTGWLSVDPMADKYPSISPYAYCAWNPVKLVDPDGNEIDDYFSLSGKYLGSDNAETHNVRIISDFSWNSLDKNENGNVDHDLAYAMSKPFSDVSGDMSPDAQLSVYQHYNPTKYRIESYEEDDGSSYGMRSRFERDKDPIIRIYLKGNASLIRICDYADEIISTFAHEKGHIDHYLNVGFSKYVETSVDIREQIAIKAEMSNPSWNGTREVYKQDALKYGRKYGLKINEKGEIMQ